jgi:TP901 family phage tail tape measure protein
MARFNGNAFVASTVAGARAFGSPIASGARAFGSPIASGARAFAGPTFAGARSILGPMASGAGAILGPTFSGGRSVMGPAFRTAGTMLGSLTSQFLRFGGMVAPIMLSAGSRAFGAITRTLFAPLTSALNAVGALWRNSFVVGAGAAGGAIVYAAKQAMDLESAYIQIAKASPWESGSRELGQFRAGIERLAKDPAMAGVSLDTLLGVGLTGAKLGVGEQGISALLDYVKGVSSLSLAFDDLPIERVAEEIGIISTIFGKGADHARFLGSAVDALADASVASAEHLFDVTERAASAGEQMGLTEGEVLGFSTTLLQTGMNAEAAGGALSRLYAKIAAEGPTFAESLGIDPKTFDAMKAADKVKSVIAALGKQPVGSAGFQFLQEMGIDNTRDRIALLNLANAEKELATFTGIANEELATGAHLQKSVAENSKAAWSSITLLYNQIRLLADSVGSAMLPGIKSLSAALGRLAGDLEAWVDANRATLDAWGEAFAEKFAYVGTLFSNWDDWLQVARIMLGEWGKDLLASFKILGDDLFILAEWIGKGIAQAIADGLTIAAPAILAAMKDALTRSPTDAAMARAKVAMRKRLEKMTPAERLAEPENVRKEFGINEKGEMAPSFRQAPELRNPLEPFFANTPETNAALAGPLGRIETQKTFNELAEAAGGLFGRARGALPGLGFRVRQGIAGAPAAIASVFGFRPGPKVGEGGGSFWDRAASAVQGKFGEAGKAINETVDQLGESKTFGKFDLGKFLVEGANRLVGVAGMATATGPGGVVAGAVRAATGMARGGEERKPMQAEFVSLEDMAKRIQTGALSNEDFQKRSLNVQEQTAGGVQAATRHLSELVQMSRRGRAAVWA